MYFDYGGSHSSVLAANIHAGNLNSGQVPTKEQMMSLPRFDKTTPDDFGKLYYVGVDQQQNEIYILGTRNAKFEPVIQGVSELMGLSNDFVFTCTMPYVNPILRLGGWLSRRLSFITLGRPLVFIGAKSAYPALASLVEKTRVQSLQGV